MPPSPKSPKKPESIPQSPLAASEDAPVEAADSPETATDAPAASETPEVPASDEPAVLFQAIGTLQGKVEINEEGHNSIQLAGKSYSLFFPGYRHRAWKQQREKHPDQPLFLRVYPKCLLIPRKDPIIRFEVAAWGEENPWDEGAGIFRFRGIWQFVPQLRTPVISVYRNWGVTDPTGKYKSSHLPVLMRREDKANPFKFNPKVPKEELPPRWFIQARFRFLPARNCWGWIEDLAAPTIEIPRYQKPFKAPAEKRQSNVRPPRINR